MSTLHNSPARVLKNVLVYQALVNIIYNLVQLHPLAEVPTVLISYKHDLWYLLVLEFTELNEGPKCIGFLFNLYLSIFILPLPGALEVLEGEQE